MKNRKILAGMLLVSAMLACNIPTATPTPGLLTPTPATPSATPFPSATFPALTTSTPAVPSASPIDLPVNCRLGGGVEWEAIGALLIGQSATIVGRNNSSSWWYVTTPNDPDTQCWVGATVVTTAGNLSNVPVVSNPTAWVTDIDVSVDPQDISPVVCIAPLAPIEITGSIHTNGPVTVEYRFETQQGGVMSAQTLEFDKFGTKTVEIDFVPLPAEGEFWVRLVILDPDSDPDTAQATYEINCP